MEGKKVEGGREGSGRGAPWVQPEGGRRWTKSKDKQGEP